MSFEPGTVIAGKYRVERVIGEGGMGVVLAARHLGLDETVALKLIREERGAGSEVLARFQREARAAARIKSEHVARVLDVDRLPEGDPYIVMEFIDGTDLHALVKRRGRIPAGEAASYITQACEGLAEAHALGMVHRDLKLKNLFLTQRRDGRPLIKVIDFGVVKMTPLGDAGDETMRLQWSDLANDERGRARDASLTGTSMLVGSLHYMAPEQIRASNIVTAQADVWSLGVCLYAMLTGALPFEGATVIEVCAAIQGRPPVDVRALVPEIPDDVADAVSRSLEKDVRRRFGNVAELASALAAHGLDPAAPARIETILQSSSGSRARRASEPPVVASDSGALSTLSMHPVASSRMPPLHPIGRAESTIDAAAVGSLAAYPSPTAPPPAHRRWITGLVVMVVGCVATIAVWPGVTRSVHGSAATLPPAAPPEPALLTPSAPATSAPATSATYAMTTTTEAPPTPATTAKRAPPRPKPAPTKPKGESKSEPKTDEPGAYDHF